MRLSFNGKEHSTTKSQEQLLVNGDNQKHLSTFPNLSGGRRCLQKCLDEEKKLSVQDMHSPIWEGVPNSRQPRNSEAVLIEVDPIRKEGS